MVGERGTRKSRAEWNAVRPLLQRLWLEEKRHMKGPNGLQETMEREHGFSATPNQYDVQFRAWEWHRNQKGCDWQAIAQAISVKERRGEKWEVLIHGRSQPQALVRRKISPFISSLSQARDLGSQLPSHVAVKSSCTQRPELLLNLSFNQIELILFGQSSWCPEATETCQMRLRSNMSSELLPRTNQVVSRGLHDAIALALDSVAPVSTQYVPYWSYSGGEASPILKMILFAFSNNLAGLSSTQTGAAMRYLQLEHKVELLYLFSAVIGPTRRALAYGLFVGGIEADDAATIDLLLKEQETAIHANKTIMVVEYQGCHGKACEISTPISRAAVLGHTATIRTLLKYGAHVDYKLPGGQYKRALEDYVHHFKGKVAGSVKFEHQLYKLLYEAGGTMQNRLIHYLLDISQDSARHFILNELSRSMERWIKSGVLRLAFRKLDESAILAIIEKMVDLGFDVNTPLPDYPSSSMTKLMDIAIDQRMPRVMHLLERRGAQELRQVLLEAIRGQAFNLARLRYIVEEVKIPVSQHSEIKHCPLQVAISCKNLWAVEFLLERGIHEGMSLEEQQHWSLKAELIRQSEIDTASREKKPSDGQLLKAALNDAIEHQLTYRVEHLLSSGAEASGGNLVQAILQRNVEVVHLLLQYDADPNCWEDIDEDAPLDASIWVGDHEIVKIVLEAGARVDYSPSGESTLVTAIRANRLDMLELLIRYGACLNAYEEDGDFCLSPLTAAAEKEDIEAAIQLLDAGAEPYDQAALDIAMRLENKRLFTTILKYYKKRYPKGQKCFDTGFLHAVGTANTTLIAAMIALGEDCTRLRPIPKAGIIEPFIGQNRIAQITPLGYSILLGFPGNYSLMKMLITEGGCDLTKPVCKYGYPILPPLTALTAAICIRDIHLVNIILEYGAEINPKIRAPFKHTPLQYAAKAGAAEMVELLIARGADVNAPPSRTMGGTALQLASREGWGSIVITLLNHGAEVDAEPSMIIARPDPYTDVCVEPWTYQGRYALEEAAENGRRDIVKILLNAGANKKSEIRDQISRGIRLAENKDQLAVSEFLQDHARPVEMSDEIQLPLATDRDGEHDLRTGEENQAFHGAVWDIGL